MFTIKMKRAISAATFIGLLLCLICSSAFSEEEFSEWKPLYEEILDGIEKDEPDRIAKTSRYLVYDLDGNGIPELVVSKGLNDAETETEFYTLEDSKLIKLGKLKTGYVIFKGNDKGEGLVIQRYLDEEKTSIQVILEEGQLKETAIEVPDNLESNTQIRDLKLIGINYKLYISQYEDMISLIHGDFPFTKPSHFPENNKYFYEELIAGKGKVHVIPEMSSHYPDYQCRFDMLKSKKHEIANISYSDLNGDGQMECIVDLKGTGVIPVRVFLSEQNGIVYAYVHEFAYENVSADKNGNLLTETEGNKTLYRLIFDKGEWFLMQLPIALAE